MTPTDLDVLVLCGGRGTRLGALTADTPKPLLPVEGRPFLWWFLRHWQAEGCRRFVLAAHYRQEQVAAFLQTYRREFPNARLVAEPEPLGTGGALRHAADHAQALTLLVLNGDSWVSQPLQPVLDDHVRRRRQFTAVAVKTSQVARTAARKGVWQVGPDGRVEQFATADAASDGWVNAGVYVVDRDLVRAWPRGAYSMEQQFPALLAGRRAGVFRSEGRLLDIGTPECYTGAAEWLTVQPAR